MQSRLWSLMIAAALVAASAMPTVAQGSAGEPTAGTNAYRCANCYFPLAGNTIVNHSWKSPAEVGLRSDVADRLKAFIDANPYTRNGRVHPNARWALWRDGYLVHVDGDFQQTQDVASLRKTWHAMTVGAAIQQGLIPSLDERISKYQTELEGNDALATWRHVITQSAGFDYPIGPYPDFKPGEMWTYSDLNLVQLTHALAKVYGRRDFHDHYTGVLDEAYFDAIGMEEWHARNKVDPGADIIDGPRLIVDMEHMGRLGLLALARGRWDGHQLIPEWFVEELETKQTYGMLSNRTAPYEFQPHELKRDPEAEKQEHPYGYLTWANTDGDYFPGADRKWASGHGAGGTKIMWNANNGLVFVGAAIEPTSEETNIARILEESIAGENPLLASRPVPQIGVWDVAEIIVPHRSGYDEPPAGLTLEARVRAPDGTVHTVPGYHDYRDVWKFEFQPQATGAYGYEARFSDGTPGESGSFRAVEPGRAR